MPMLVQTLFIELDEKFSLVLDHVSIDHWQTFELDFLVDLKLEILFQKLQLLNFFILNVFVIKFGDLILIML